MFIDVLSILPASSCLILIIVGTKNNLSKHVSYSCTSFHFKLLLEVSG